MHAIGDKQPSSIGELLGRTFIFKSEEFSNKSLFHHDWNIYLGTENDERFHRDKKRFDFQSEFTIVPGLSGEGISFKSAVAHPDAFIRHSNWICVLQRFVSDDEQYKKDASWIPSKAFGKYHGCAFRSVSYPDKFMRHNGEIVRVDDRDTTDKYEAQSAWLADEVKSGFFIGGEWQDIFGDDNAVADSTLTSALPKCAVRG